jgi:hypothetical protein
MTTSTIVGLLHDSERRDISIEQIHDSVTFRQHENQPLDEARSPRLDGVTDNEKTNAENAFEGEKDDYEEDKKGGYEQQESNVLSTKNIVTAGFPSDASPYIVTTLPGIGQQRASSPKLTRDIPSK